MLRAVILTAVVVAFAIAMRDRWGEVRDSLGDLPVWSILVGTILGFANIGFVMLSWRTLLRDLGSPLGLRDAARIFYLGQLGKYVPGSVWTVVAQVELGRDHGVPPRRSVAASAVSLGIALIAGLLMAALTLPYASTQALEQYWWAMLALPLAGVALFPRNVDRLTRWLLRVLRREPPDHAFTWHGVLRSLLWQLAGSLSIGLQVWVLTVGAGANVAQAAPVAIGGSALAWCAGFLAVPVPAGAGVREAVYIAVLAPVLPAAPALAVALVSRAIATVGDGLFAGTALVASRKNLARGRRETLSASVPDDGVPALDDAGSGARLDPSCLSQASPRPACDDGPQPTPGG
ncbi:MAG: flippase-like domain-containing protein [Acidothermus sp.]|nr:flippase-like domain-containing protein [Acidothermus sp.]